MAKLEQRVASLESRHHKNLMVVVVTGDESSEKALDRLDPQGECRKRVKKVLLVSTGVPRRDDEIDSKNYRWRY